MNESSDRGSEPTDGVREAHAARMGSDRIGTALGVVGAVVGGVLGCLLFLAIAKQGFYAIVLPGALVGFGCGGLSGRKSTSLGVLCGAIGLLAGVLAEWRFAPFIKDKSLSVFLTHLHDLSGVTLVLIAVGACFAFWFGQGREGGVWPRKVVRPPAEQGRNQG